MIPINQECDCNVYYDKKTVDWLVNNTGVKTFDRIKLEGYQRKVNDSHVTKIVEYLKSNSFYLPTAIICASEEEVSDQTKLNIVDGQHRVEAFKELKKRYPKEYSNISQNEIPVIILEKPSKSLEVNTFITINKTSRKVDTSLAYVLKNQISRKEGGSDSSSLTRREFLAVELAILLNGEGDKIWRGRISLEGNPTKNSYETISLNSFVNSLKVLINNLNKRQLIEIEWKTEEELQSIINQLKDIYLFMWERIKDKWSDLFNEKTVNKSVLQGNIGVTSLNKYVVLQLEELEKLLEKLKRLEELKQLKQLKGLGKLKELEELEELEKLFEKLGKVKPISDIASLKEHIKKYIEGLNIDSEEWLKGKRFSQFSSAAGFNIVARILFDSYKID